MKTTLEIPDDIYRQAKIRAAHDNRKLKDLVSDGLRLVLGLSSQTGSRSLRRMKKAPVTIRKGNEIRVLSNDAMAAILEADGNDCREISRGYQCHYSTAAESPSSS